MPVSLHIRARHDRRRADCAAPRNYARWTPRELRRLPWLADQYRNDAQRLCRVAAALNRSPRAIQQKLQRIGWQWGMTLREISRRLGIHERVLIDLIAQGRFVPGLTQHNRPAPYSILEDDLWAWMEDMASWHFWRPENIADPCWRAHFSELRHDWLTGHEAAAILHVTPSYIHRLRVVGCLPGRKVSERAVWYHRPDIEAIKARLDGGCYLFSVRHASSRGEEVAA